MAQDELNAAFITAVINRNLAEATALFQNPQNVPDVDYVSPKHNGYTALILATQAGYEELVDFLLEKGAHPQQTDAQGSTDAVRIAIVCNHLSIFNKFMERALDVNSNISLNDYLITAVNCLNFTIMQKLLSRGAKPDILYLGENIVHMVISGVLLREYINHPIPEVEFQNAIHIIDFVKASYPHLLSAFTTDMSLAEKTTEAQYWGFATIEDAREAGMIFVHVPYFTNRTALMLAAKTGNVILCQKLVAYGAEVNETYNQESLTALSYALKGNHADIVNYLLQNGADPNLNFPFVNHYHLALKVGNELILQDLLDAGAIAEFKPMHPYQNAVNGLFKAARHGNASFEQLRDFFIKGASFNQRTIKKRNPILQVACEAAQVEVVGSLLKILRTLDERTQWNILTFRNSVGEMAVDIAGKYNQGDYKTIKVALMNAMQPFINKHLFKAYAAYSLLKNLPCDLHLSIFNFIEPQRWKKSVALEESFNRALSSKAIVAAATRLFSQYEYYKTQHKPSSSIKKNKEDIKPKSLGVN